MLMLLVKIHLEVSRVHVMLASLAMVLNVMVGCLYFNCYTVLLVCVNVIKNIHADIDECSSNTLNECQINATCINTIGNYTCECMQGFEGDGWDCQGIYIVFPLTKETVTIVLLMYRHQ